MNSRGFTMVESLVAIVLAGSLTAAAYSVLVRHARLTGWQRERAQLDQTLRSAQAILPADLRELAARDVAGGDLLAISDTAVTLAAMRGLYLTCRPPLGAGTSGTVVVEASPVSALREPVPGQDSVLVFAESDVSRPEGLWIHSALAGVSPDTCADGSPGLAFGIAGVSAAGGLNGVAPGAPLRIAQPIRLRSYRDTDGDWWVGVAEYQGGGWSGAQPLLGPVGPRGLRFRYYDSGGGETAEPTRVARIAVTVVARSGVFVRTPSGDLRHLTDSVTTEVALRGDTAR